MMDNSNTNDFAILGTLMNYDASGIIARASQIYDSVANKSVEERISDLDKKIDQSSATEEKLKFDVLQEL